MRGNKVGADNAMLTPRSMTWEAQASCWGVLEATAVGGEGGGLARL